MTIEKFYTIMHFLEYFRVKHDNKLRNVIKIIWYSLVKSEEINNFDIEKVSFHFSKQDYFSHKMFKKISRKYFKVIKFEMNTINSFFSKKEINYISNKGKCLYTIEGKHVLTIINYEFDLFFSKKVDMHPKSKCLFLIFKYIRYKVFTYLRYMHNNFESIVFVQCYISDETIKSRNNTNLNFVNLEKNCFYRMWDGNNKINECMFFAENASKGNYSVYEILFIKNLDIVDNIVEILKRTYHKSTPEEVISKNSNFLDKNKDFYLKLLNDEKSKAKFKIFESFVYVSSSLSLRYFYEYNGSNNKTFDLKSANNDISDFNCHSDSVKFLFKNYDLSSINKPSLYDFCVTKSNLKALSNLLNLKELNFLRINFENISLSELFSDEDLIFIANYKNLKELEFEGCYIQQKTYLHCIKMLFINEFYIELICSHLSEEIIQFIKEAFKVKNSDINVIQGFGVSKNIYL
ncbi:hypothetical protein CWI37_2055p0010 [Hamiltosporidium tvaerminnensis]|uniref:Uncharacterized protein n=1 Tax=Hamiltosporidium tvaerminnensis TaxID=1176355 RepID=A0A4Q9KTE0_9MICR|nr:hypothetical protein CWI37_2055p0010 [Hamiltosporidium tvaerminnensis]